MYVHSLILANSTSLQLQLGPFSCLTDPWTHYVPPLSNISGHLSTSEEERLRTREWWRMEAMNQPKLVMGSEKK